MEKPSTSLGSKDCQRSDNSVARGSLPPSLLLRAFQEFSRAEFLLIYDTFAMPLTRQVACICELFFFLSLSLFLPLLFFSHNRTPRCHERREKFQRDRQICRRHVRARLIRFAANFRKLLDVPMSFVISIREWRDYFGKTLENYYQLWDKAFDGIN